MSENRTLCEFCQAVELEPQLLCDIPVRQWDVGTGARLATSSCPLCEVIRRVYYEEQRLRVVPRRLPLEQRVYLKWVYSDGIDTGGRPGFQVGGKGANQRLEWINGISICLQGFHGASNPVRQICCLKPYVSGNLDTHEIRQRVKLCVLEHTETCSPKIDQSPLVGYKFPGLKVLRLLDVEALHIVEFRKDEKVPGYVALSYVWGSANTVRLTKANILELTTTSGFKASQFLLPRTIEDSITLAQQLSLRFLWVDTLCLVQNDFGDVSLGVNVMDCIYEAAYLTIIAAEGFNAHSGLPGVQPESRLSQKNFEVKPGVFLGLETRLDWLLERSLYRTRGWTFQEQFLSKRALYFVNGRLFFRCRSVDWPENFHRPMRSGSGPASVCGRLVRALRLEHFVTDFTRILRSYSHSQFSNDVDILRAFSGILRRVCDRLGNHGAINGLPIALLDGCLVFEPLRNNALRRRSIFPSYSWAGWRGPVAIGLGGLPDNEWQQSSTWIIFHTRYADRPPDLVLLPYRALKPSDTGHANYQKSPAIWFFPGWRDLFLHESFQTSPTADNGREFGNTTYALLQFWTFSMFFKISIFDRLLGRAGIIYKDVRVGETTLDGFEENPFFELDRDFEFIFLSLTPKSSPKAPKCHVMMVEQCGPFAERRGIGYVELGDIRVDTAISRPYWKEIILA